MASQDECQFYGRYIEPVSSVLQPLVSKKKQLTTSLVVLAFVVVMAVATFTVHKWSGEYSDTAGSDWKHPDDEDKKNGMSAGIRSRGRRSLETNADGTSFGGATYIRWGRTVCPDDPHTELVYAGSAGGSFNYNEGGASNLLCLPMDPIWNKYNDASASSKGYIEGTEYLDDSLLGRQNAEKLLYHNVPCAVCRSLKRTSSVMIPARTACYKGWHLEYQGYLMARNYQQKAALQYVCVDESPEAEPKGYVHEEGVFLYHVEAACGSLPCPPYVDARELTCAVCTRISEDKHSHDCGQNCLLQRVAPRLPGMSDGRRLLINATRF